jgi:hypothetical protein
VALKSREDAEAQKAVPLLAGKTWQGAVTTYVCENFACQAPLVGAEVAERALVSP